MKTNVILISLAVLVGMAMMGLWVWGVVIAFQSHILTGFIILIIEPAPVIIGMLDGFFDVGVTDAITNLIKGE